MSTLTYRPCVGRLLVTVLLVHLGFGFGMVEAQEEGQGEVLTRGPVHEAFAEAIQLNPQPGVAVTAPPPAPVEELAPDQKPEGEQVVWIPGYWAWDDERSQFLWVSGVWRNVPPGRQWVPGYWNPISGGHQWISGYWAPVEQPVARTEYLAAPPASLEYGPQAVAPSPDYVWVPGSWVWRGHYVWRPGYWVAGQPERCWIPDTYVWTPDGYVFVAGYWDYPITTRGVLFAPVYWEPEVIYVREVRRYSPTVVINLTFLSDCLFVRPRYHHYYFGDYYDEDCRRRGYYTVHAWYERNRGCEPVYAHRRWEHRKDRDWDRRESERDEHRRNHPDSRPSRAYVSSKDGKKAKTFTTASQETVALAAPLSEASSKDAQKLKKLEKADREAVTQQAHAGEKQIRAEQKEAQKREQAVEKVAKAEKKNQDPEVAKNPFQVEKAREPKPVNGKANRTGQEAYMAGTQQIRPEKIKEPKVEKRKETAVRIQPAAQEMHPQPMEENSKKYRVKTEEIRVKSAKPMAESKNQPSQQPRVIQEKYKAPKVEKNILREEKAYKSEKYKEAKNSSASLPMPKESGKKGNSKNNSNKNSGA